MKNHPDNRKQQRKGNMLKMKKNEKETYREFDTQEEARRFGLEKDQELGEKYKELIKYLNHKNKDSAQFGNINPVADYTGYGYQRMNHVLRGTPENCEYFKNVDREILLLEAVIASAKPVNKLIVYRCISNAEWQEISSSEDDDPYRDKGFLSTCLVKDTAIKMCKSHPEKYQVILRIYIANECHAIYVPAFERNSENGGCRQEEELLLFPTNQITRRKSMYRSVEKINGIEIYDVTLISPEPWNGSI